MNRWKKTKSDVKTYYVTAWAATRGIVKCEGYSHDDSIHIIGLNRGRGHDCLPEDCFDTSAPESFHAALARARARVETKKQHAFAIYSKLAGICIDDAGQIVRLWRLK